MPDNKGKKDGVGSGFLPKGIKYWRADKSDNDLKKLFTDLALECAKEIPGLNVFVSAGKVLVDALIDKERQERERRLRGYILGVVQDEQYNEDVEFRADDVIPVIRKLAMDDESAKTEYYIRLTLRLGRMSPDKLSVELRSHFIRMVSELTCYELEFAREFYIRATVPLKGYLNFQQATVEITNVNGGRQHRARNNLLNWGLLSQETRVAGFGGGTGVLCSQTDDMTCLMELLFHKQDFQAELINKSEKEIVDVLIIYEFGGPETEYATYLPECIKEAGLSVRVVDSNENHFKDIYAWRCIRNAKAVTDTQQIFPKINVWVQEYGVNGSRNASFEFPEKTFINENSDSALTAELRSSLEKIVTFLIDLPGKKEHFDN